MTAPPLRPHSFSAGMDASWWMAQLEAMYDPGTFSYLERLGVGPGWRCMEAGAGGGSVALWLGERVRPDGFVVALDRDVWPLKARRMDNVEVRTADLDGDPLEQSAYDLVHARLVLEHLPRPEDTLARLVAALRPRGWILIEDMDWRGVHAVAGPGAEVFERVTRAQCESWSAGGYHGSLGYRIPGLLRRHGLTDVDCEGRTRLIEGGTPRAAAFIGAILRQFGPWYVARGWLTEQDLQQALAWVSTPGCAGVSASLVATWARRGSHGPAADGVPAVDAGPA